jgi:hypothetical protein
MSPTAAQKFLPDFTAFEFVPAETLDSTPIRVGYEYWLYRRGNRRFPSRSDLCPRDIAGALQHMSLIKVEGDDFVYRVVGDAIVRAFDIPIQNRRMSEIVYDEPGFGTIVVPLLRKVAHIGEPVAIRGTTGHDVTRANFTDYQNVLLPLGPDDQAVDHIVTFSSYTSRPFIPSLD